MIASDWPARRLLTVETASGLAILLSGGIGLLAVGDLEIGTAGDMGPGYLPRLIAWLLLAAGVGMTLAALRRDGTALPPMSARPALLISIAVTVFGALVDRAGIVIAVVASTAVASLASGITRHRETPWLCAVLALMAALAFVKGLGLAIPIWPR